MDTTQFILGIPSWVYILFIILVYMGIRSSRARVFSVPFLFFVPAIFIILAIDGMKKSYALSPDIFWFWLGGAVLGVLIGFLQVRKQNVVAHKDRKLIEVPGSWSMLIMILFIFSIEFVVHSLHDTHTAIATTPAFINGSWLIAGLIVGIIFGRNLTYYLKYLRSKE